MDTFGSALRSGFHETVNSSTHFLLCGYNKINHAADNRILQEIKCINEGKIMLLLQTRSALIHDEVKNTLKVGL